MGKSLWSLEALQSNVATVPGRSSKEEFFVSETTSDKIMTITGDSHLQLNLLCQTVDLQGMASYLRDSKYLRHQAQASFKYEITTELRQLTMEHLKKDKIEHPEILEEDIATHVIVGIKYGGQIIMNFVEELDKEECSQKLKSELLLEKLKGIFSGKVDGGYTGNDYSRDERIKCNLYSDFPVDTNPTNVKEAVELYKKLPSLTSSGNIGIPVSFHLCPLQSLAGKGGDTVKEIRSSLVQKICFIKEKIHFILASCEDLVQADGFPSAKRKLRLFMEMVQQYKHFLIQKVSELHREISCGSADNDHLDTFLREQECSVFSHSGLSKWLSVKEQEMKVMQGLMKSLKTPFVGRGELESYFLNPNIYHLVCLAFKLFPDTDTQLQNMERFLEKEPVQEFEQPVMMPFASFVRASLERFLTLRDDNLKCKAAKFVITEEPLGKDPKYVCLIPLPNRLVRLYRILK
ncbi:stonustoxin subunit beta-like [Dendronephthya gigantea]|uniref:stonustoxin subunit beta-like n=1 Tax=Dendronephthya gigantea TaxID=151771 RepID=UPI00106AFB90|nr:stonustoxin subunit beta-like [Dendronephthya gigantea]